MTYYEKLLKKWTNLNFKVYLGFVILGLNWILIITLVMCFNYQVMPFIRKLRIDKQDYDDFFSNKLQNDSQSQSILADLMGVLGRKEYKIILTSEGNDLFELKLDENNDLYFKML